MSGFWAACKWVHSVVIEIESEKSLILTLTYENLSASGICFTIQKVKIKNTVCVKKEYFVQVKENKIFWDCRAQAKKQTESANVLSSWVTGKHLILLLLKLDAMQQLQEICVQSENNKT